MVAKPPLFSKELLFYLSKKSPKKLLLDKFKSVHLFN